MRGRLFLALLGILLGALAIPAAARAETLRIALSHEEISIDSNFTGARIAVFGAILRDRAAVARAGDYDIVVTVRGPRGLVTVREKEQVGPFWLNLDQRRYIAIPSFIAVLSNRPLPEIASVDMRRRLRLGMDALVPPQGARGRIFDIDEPDFRRALIRLRMREGLFYENPHGVRLLPDNLFQAAIRIPGTVPLGTFNVDVALLAEGVELAKVSSTFQVNKGGFEERMAMAAHEHGLLYGLATAAMALLLGWGATVIFRRD